MTFRLATASHGLGWSPRDFWNATPREFWWAMDAAEEHAKAVAKAQGGHR